MLLKILPMQSLALVRLGHFQVIKADGLFLSYAKLVSDFSPFPSGQHQQNWIVNSYLDCKFFGAGAHFLFWVCTVLAQSGAPVQHN